MSNASEGNSRNGVKRNLFGTVPNDHNKSQENLRLEANRITREKSRIWNFDFEVFEPLPPGRYKWERVGKRLQTRTSPVQETASTSEHCLEGMDDCSPAFQTRYNLRTRECFRPIEPESCPRLTESGLSGGGLAVPSVLTSRPSTVTGRAPPKKRRKQNQSTRKRQLEANLETT